MYICIYIYMGSGGRLANYRLVKGCPSVEEYVLTGGQDRRRVLAALRCGCLPLQIEKGRTIHPKVALENRVCRLCNSGEIEDATHFIIYQMSRFSQFKM